MSRWRNAAKKAAKLASLQERARPDGAPIAPTLLRMPPPALPVLYSFRRCPFAIRARLALKYAQIQIELREVALRAKPAEMLSRSPKGTVPVLCLPDGTVLEQSLDIMRWALGQNDPNGWLAVADINDANALIATNDGPFKDLLDRYKYADRYPDQPASGYRKHAEECFIAPLEKRLSQHDYLCGGAISFVDVAIMPFVRQFAMSDEEWFAQSPYSALRDWLARFVESALFDAVMTKHATWQPGSPRIVL